jgi:hypothetical protein
MRDLPPTPVIVVTRRSLHRVAEHVLSAALKTATGQIALEQAPGGFRTPLLPDGRVVSVDGTDLTVTAADGVRRSPLTTLADAARLADIEPGFPWTKHPPATPLEPDEPLSVDPEAAAVLAGWFALGADALRDLAAAIVDDVPSDAALYPEHFDLAIGAAEVNYGVSPGDDSIELPYAYVGPYEGPPTADDFWNAPFGSYVTIQALSRSDDALAFFLDGRERIRRARRRSS